MSLDTNYEQIQQEESTKQLFEECDGEKVFMHVLDYIKISFKHDYLLSLEEKVNLTSLVILYHQNIQLEDFFEEECHLALVEWIYVRLDRMNDERVFHLLYNILIIFQIIPIKVADLFQLKIFEKLNKIRKYIKHNLNTSTLNVNGYSMLDKLLNYWTEYFSNSNSNTKNYINRKRKRSALITEEVTSKVNAENENTILDTNTGIHSKHKHKTVKWDESLTRVKLFEIGQQPSEVN